MRGAEGVVGTLLAARKTRDAALLAQTRHAGAPAGQDLMAVGLVADIPDNAVVRRVECVMQRDGQLHRAEIRGKMPTRGGHRFDDEFAQFGREQLQVLAREPAQIGRIGNGIENRIFVAHAVHL